MFHIENEQSPRKISRGVHICKKKINSIGTSFRASLIFDEVTGALHYIILSIKCPLSRNGTTNNIRISKSERCIPVFNIYFSMYFIRKIFGVSAIRNSNIFILCSYAMNQTIFSIGSVCGVWILWLAYLPFANIIIFGIQNLVDVCYDYKFI